MNRITIYYLNNAYSWFVHLDLRVTKLSDVIALFEKSYPNEGINRITIE
jgi:hypothetical protein